jgi:hypothetical protein
MLIVKWCGLPHARAGADYSIAAIMSALWARLFRSHSPQRTIFHAWPVLALTLLVTSCWGADESAGVGEDPGHFVASVTVLPGDFLTLIAPFDGTIVAAPVAGRILQPPPDWPDGWFMNPEIVPQGFQALLGEMKSYAVAQLSNSFDKDFKALQAENSELAEVLSSLGLKKRPGNPPPWEFEESWRPQQAALLRCAFDTIREGAIPHAVPPERELIVKSGNAAVPDPKVNRWVAFMRQRLGQVFIQQQALAALDIVLTWLQRTDYWMLENGVAKTPDEGFVWEPNHLDLLERASFTEPAHVAFVLPRSELWQPLAPATSLDRFIRYWRWVVKQNILDHNDVRFLRAIPTGVPQPTPLPAIGQSPPDAVAIAEDLIKDAQNAEQAMRGNLLLAESLRMCLHAPFYSPATTNSTEARKRLEKEINSTKTYQSYFRDVTISEEVLTNAAIALSSAVGRHIADSTSFESAEWLANQLRPSISYTGKILQVSEEAGRVRVPYGLDPQNNPLAYLTFAGRLRTQDLPVGVDRQAQGVQASLLARAVIFDGRFGLEAESPYTRMKSIELQSALPISATVRSAAQTQNGDALMNASQTLDYARAEVDIALRREGDLLLMAQTAKTKAFWKEYASRHYGFLFVADSAVVESSLVANGEVLSRGDAISVVRPVFQSEIRISVPAHEPPAASLIPGSILRARVTSPASLPISKATAQALSTNSSREVLTQLLTDLAHQYFATNTFQARVRSVTESGYNDNVFSEARIALEIPPSQRSVQIPENTPVQIRSAMKEIGLRVEETPPSFRLILECGCLKPGSRYKVEFLGATQ